MHDFRRDVDGQLSILLPDCVCPSRVRSTEDKGVDCITILWLQHITN
jgi:hypothetical protein